MNGQCPSYFRNVFYKSVQVDFHFLDMPLYIQIVKDGIQEATWSGVLFPFQFTWLCNNL